MFSLKEIGYDGCQIWSNVWFWFRFSSDTIGDITSRQVWSLRYFSLSFFKQKVHPNPVLLLLLINSIKLGSLYDATASVNRLSTERKRVKVQSVFRCLGAKQVETHRLNMDYLVTISNCLVYDKTKRRCLATNDTTLH